MPASSDTRGPSPADDERRQLRWQVYVLLIVVGLGIMAGRVMSVTARHQRTPFLSANDRSRIATMRALVAHGTYAIDEIIYEIDDNGQIERDAEGVPIRNGVWQTIDMVRHPDRDGVMRSYSSKPTLLPTLLAGEYWLVKQITGATVGERPFYIGRVLLLLTNVLPMALYFVIMAVLIERWGRTDWGRLFAMTFAVLGTFLPTFAVTINNHLPAAVSAAIVVLAVTRIWYDDDRRWFWFVLAGLFAAFTAANELPALSFFCLVGAALLWKAPLKTILLFTPAAVVVAAAALGTNYIAHDSWRPPYAHRKDGPVVTTLDEGASKELDLGSIPADLDNRLVAVNEDFSLTDDAQIAVTTPGERWVLSDRDEAIRFAIVRDGGVLNVHEWDRWYDFKGAYWRSGAEEGVDKGESSALAYVLHCTFGHHGVFSLTPVWLLAVAGMIALVAGRNSNMRELAILVAIASVVVLGFYLSRPLIDRTYGGWTTGLRWMFWFAPLWILMLLPAADWIGRHRFWRALALLLLVVSTFSAFYGSGNPWTHPWLYNYWEYIEWTQY